MLAGWTRTEQYNIMREIMTDAICKGHFHVPACTFSRIMLWSFCTQPATAPSVHIVFPSHIIEIVGIV